MNLYNVWIERNIYSYCSWGWNPLKLIRCSSDFLSQDVDDGVDAVANIQTSYGNSVLVGARLFYFVWSQKLRNFRWASGIASQPFNRSISGIASDIRIFVHFGRYLNAQTVWWLPVYKSKSLAWNAIKLIRVQLRLAESESRSNSRNSHLHSCII